MPPTILKWARGGERLEVNLSSWKGGRGLGTVWDTLGKDSTRRNFHHWRTLCRNNENRVSDIGIFLLRFFQFLEPPSDVLATDRASTMYSKCLWFDWMCCMVYALAWYCVLTLCFYIYTFAHVPSLLMLWDQVPKALLDIVAILYRNANRKLVYPMNIRIKIQNFKTYSSSWNML